VLEHINFVSANIAFGGAWNPWQVATFHMVMVDEGHRANADAGELLHKVTADTAAPDNRNMRIRKLTLPSFGKGTD
jgi:hypothetical protein